jgi:hypothetical protein
MIALKLLRLFLISGAVLDCANAQQPAERFDNLLMIETGDWIEAARKSITLATGNIYEYGYIIVNVSGENEEVRWVLGAHQNVIKDGPFDKGFITAYSIKFFDIQNKKQAVSQVSTKKYVESVNFFWAVVSDAGVNKMPSETNADTKYYIFCRNIDSDQLVATGQFRSCVLIAPTPDNKNRMEIFRMLQMVREP